MLGDLLHVAVFGTPSQQSAVYSRMQGLDAAVENFGSTGHLRHLPHLKLRAACNSANVPPVLTSRYPASVNTRANSTRPVLSYTLSSA